MVSNISSGQVAAQAVAESDRLRLLKTDTYLNKNHGLQIAKYREQQQQQHQHHTALSPLTLSLGTPETVGAGPTSPVQPSFLDLTDNTNCVAPPQVYGAGTPGSGMSISIKDDDNGMTAAVNRHAMRQLEYTRGQLKKERDQFHSQVAASCVNPVLEVSHAPALHPPLSPVRPLLIEQQTQTVSVTEVQTQTDDTPQQPREKKKIDLADTERVLLNLERKLALQEEKSSRAEAKEAKKQKKETEKKKNKDLRRPRGAIAVPFVDGTPRLHQVQNQDVLGYLTLNDLLHYAEPTVSSYTSEPASHSPPPPPSFHVPSHMLIRLTRFFNVYDKSKIPSVLLILQTFLQYCSDVVGRPRLLFEHEPSYSQRLPAHTSPYLSLPPPPSNGGALVLAHPNLGSPNGALIPAGPHQQQQFPRHTFRVGGADTGVPSTLSFNDQLVQHQLIAQARRQQLQQQQHQLIYYNGGDPHSSSSIAHVQQNAGPFQQSQYAQRQSYGGYSQRHQQVSSTPSLDSATAIERLFCILTAHYGPEPVVLRKQGLFRRLLNKVKGQGKKEHPSRHSVVAKKRRGHDDDGSDSDSEIESDCDSDGDSETEVMSSASSSSSINNTDSSNNSKKKNPIRRFFSSFFSRGKKIFKRKSKKEKNNTDGDGDDDSEDDAGLAKDGKEKKIKAAQDTEQKQETEQSDDDDASSHDGTMVEEVVEVPKVLSRSASSGAVSGDDDPEDEGEKKRREYGRKEEEQEVETLTL